MDKDLFAKARASLGKTQKELAQLLGVSLKAVQSYEQGWRTVPLHIERQLFFLLINQRSKDLKKRHCCWQFKKCNVKHQCPAWEFQSGHLCWFLSGTLCNCSSGKTGKEKMDNCRQCPVLTSLL
ncbi:MAG: helix-turn-helix transcriptional regulator [Desulfobulbaceae bacterium]|nr:helix-turn-helix transcriptional regulator [Desulfobulbaceae bacterium]